MSIQLKAFIFVVVSFGFFWLSRRSLRSWKSHGFWRYFTWEAFLILILVNANYWFIEPFRLVQIISWILLIISIIYIIYGTVSIKLAGKASDERGDPLLIGIEKTTQLVKTGAYKYIRHPMYGSFIFGALGTLLKNISWQSLTMTIIVISLAISTALKEEKENIEYFGDAYIEYRKQNRMFIPFIF